MPIDRRRPAATLIFVALGVAGCGGHLDVASPAPMALIDLPRDCTKDPATVTDVIEGLTAPTCVLDSDCACGLHCNDFGFCSAECVTTTDPSYGCASGMTCDNWGQCVTAAPPPPPPTTLPLLAASPLATVLDAPASGNWATTAITLSLASSDPSLAAHPELQPTIHVAGATALPPGCSGGDPSAPCSAANVSELEVACASGAPFARECTLTPPWDLVGGDMGVSGTRTVYVRPIAGATGSNWQLRFSSDQIADSPTTVSLTRRDATPIPFDGRYSGTLTLGGGDGPQLGPSLPVTGYARNGYVLLVDNAHVLAPTGRLRVQQNGAPMRTTWLSGDNGAVAVEIAIDSLTQDSHAGTLSGAFHVRLPDWPHVASGVTAQGGLAWRFNLQRTDALPGPDCTTDSTCGPGNACDRAMRTCVPGPAFMANTLFKTPTDAMLTAALNIDGAQVAADLHVATSAARATADAAERLLCYEGAPQSHEEQELSNARLTTSGDQTCPNTFANLPLATQLPLLPDGQTAMSFGDIFQKCMNDLAAPADESHATDPHDAHPCISLARVYPALVLLAATDGRDDRRAALLLEKYVADWTAVQGFFTRNGLQTWQFDETMSGSSPIDLGHLLDQVAAGWNVVLDERLASALVTLPPSLLARPDYRDSDRPIAYWPAVSSFTDVEGGHTLASSSDHNSASVSFPDGPLAHDLTAVVQTSYDLFNSYRRFILPGQPGYVQQGSGATLLQSPWLNARFERRPSSLYETGTTRDVSPSFVVMRPSWSACLQSAILAKGMAWSWDPANDHCAIFAGVGNRIGSTTTMHTGYLDPSDYSSTPPARTDDGYDRLGSDYSYGASTEAQCAQSCQGSVNCVAWSWSKSASYCYLKGNENPFPLKVPNSGVVSGLSTRGAAIEQELGDVGAYQDGVTVTGTDIRDFATSGGWESCVDACRADQTCEGWVYQKQARYCWLRKNLTGFVSNPLNASGGPGGLDLVTSHQSPHGTELARAHLTTDLHLTGITTLNGQGQSVGMVDPVLAIVRDATKHLYRFYSNGWPVGADVPFSELPYSTQPAGVTVGTGLSASPTYARVEQLALFDTAVDDNEIAAIGDRVAHQQANPVTRDSKMPPPANVNDEHGVGLPVSFVEAVETELALLSGYIDAQTGQLVAECTQGGATPTRDALLARAGDALRRDAVMLSLADEMHDRAGHVECRSDADCASISGAVCGGGHTNVAIDATSMSRTGGMTSCALPFLSGICAPNTASLSGPGAAQASTSFTVTAAGNYTLWGLFYLTSANSDSFWLSVDNGAWSPWEAGVSSDADATADGWRWVHRSNLALTAGAHTITIAQREASSALGRLIVSDDAALIAPPLPEESLPAIHQDVCTNATGTPAKVAPAWETRWTKSRASVDSARAQLMASLGSVSACKNPLGIEPGDVPLYFRDPAGTSGKYFASSDYLLGLVQAALGPAAQLYAAAQNSWLEQQAALFQANQDVIANQERIESIETNYEQQLADLCGVPMGAPGQLLTQFAAGTLDVNSCFVKATSDCRANFQGPLSNAAAGCYNGAVGEALYAMNAESVAVDSARQKLSIAQATYENTSQHCVFLQGTQKIVDAHYAELDKLRAIGGVLDTISSLLNPQQMANLASGAKGSGISLVVGFFDQQVNQAIDREKAAFEEEIAERNAAEDVRQCFAAADIDRSQIVEQVLEIRAQIDKFAQAQAGYDALLLKLAQLLPQAQAAVAREQGRTLVHPAFDYWLDQNINAYAHQMTWVRRLLYMALLAVEYDSQTSTGLRAQVLDVHTPLDVQAALSAISSSAAYPKINGGNPNAYQLVLSLKNDLLRLPSATRLSDFVRDKAQRIYDTKGNLLGAGVRFAMTPDVDVHGLLAGSCGERNWTVTANVSSPQYQNSTDGTRVTVRLIQENTFSSQWCTDGHDTPMQTSTVRPTTNLFNPTAGTTTFTPAPPWSPANIQATVEKTADQMGQGSYSEGDVTDFADRGLYGNYIIVFTDPTLDLSQIVDVDLRFDFLAVTANR